MSDLQNTLEAMAHGVALFDSDDELITCNSAFRSLTAPASDVLSDGTEWAHFENALEWRGVYTERSIAALRLRIEELLDHPETIADTLQLELPSGGWHDARLAITRDDALMLTLRDVSAERMEAIAREESERLLRTILDTAPASLVVYDMDARRLLFQTPSSKALFGEFGNNIGGSWADPNKRADYLTELLAAGYVDKYDALALNGEGETFPAQLSARIVNHNGSRVIVATTHDMSEPYRQRDALKLASQRLTDAIEALDQGFALFDAEARLLMANSVFTEVNAPLADALFSGATRHDLAQAARAVGYPVGAVAWSADMTARYEFTLPDGRIFAAARSDASDGGTVIIWRDITEARAAAAELARSREMAFQTEKLTALGELLAGVAHELNNPLSVVVGQALMLQEEGKDPDTTRRVAKISTAAERCSKIVKTFLAMARQKALSTAPVQLNDVIAIAVDVAGMGPQAEGVEMTLDLQEGLPLVQADDDQITQVFLNLLMNAAQAMAGQDGAVIHVATRHIAGSDHVTARVTDNGPGIPDHDRSRIFEPFFTTKDVGEGTGVGLALCRQIVATHGGLLTLEPSTGRGAEFLLSLPLAVAKTAVKGTDPTPSARPKARVLVVEDEPEVAEIITDILEATGADVDWTAAATDALSRLDHTRYDAVFSDLRMPGMNGRAFLTHLRKSHPQMVSRLAFVTGDSMSDDAEAIRAEAGCELLEKPVAPKDLRALLARLLNKDPPP